MAKVQDDKGNWGEWKTISGRKVFIRDGEDLATAMERSGKFKTKFSQEEVNKLKQQGRKGMAQAIDKENNKLIDNDMTIKELDDTAQWLYDNDRDEWNKFTDNELKELAKMTQITDGNPGGRAYDDEVWDEMDKRGLKLDNNELKETLISDVSRDLGIEPGSDEEWMLNELYDNSIYNDDYTVEQGNPLEGMANDRIKEKEAEYNKDLDYVKRIMAGEKVIDDKYNEELDLDTAKHWLKKDYMYLNNLASYSPEEVDKALAKDLPEIFGNTNRISNLSNSEVYEEALSLRDETSDYSLREKIDRKLNSIDRLNKRGEGFADKPTNELRDILKEEATRDKGSIEIKDNNGELTGYTEGERVEYHHSGSTGLMANVYSTDEGSLSGQYFEIPKEYQGDKLKEYSLKEIERLKSDKKAYDTRQEEGMDKFIQQVDMYGGTREYSSEDLKRMEKAGIRPMANSYTGGGWEGINSHKNLSTKEQAKAITDAMKKKYSDVKISKKSDVYSGGSSIDFNIMSSEKDLYISDKDIDKLGSEQLYNTDITRGYGFDRWAEQNISGYKENSQFTVDDVKKYAKEQVANMRKRDNQNVKGNEWYLSDYGKKVVSELNKEADSYTYSDNDGMVDYFDHGTYMHISIGKWNKPYEVKPKVAKTKVDNVEAKIDRYKKRKGKNN